MSEKTISIEASEIASFSLIQTLLETLIKKQVLSHHDALSVVDQSIHLNEKALTTLSRTQNEGATILLEKLHERLELVHREHVSKTRQDEP